MRNILIFVLNVSALLAQTTYTGSAFTIAADNVTTSTLNILDSGNITDVNVTISGSEACDIEYLDISLQSPYGTIIELINIGTLNGSAFSQTTFDDEASTAIDSGLAPYFGNYQPIGNLSSFNSEEMNGHWNLAVYHNQGCGSEITAWSVTITYDDNTPDPPPIDPGVTYTGSAFTIAADNVTTSTLNIPDSGNITDVNVTISGSEACDIEYLDISLQSPYGTIVELTNIGTLIGKAFYQTTFDDEASTAIDSGLAPYFGNYQPIGNLSSFDYQEINGDWILAVYHSQGCGSEITAWSITVENLTDSSDLLLDGNTVNLSGSFNFETVILSNNARINIQDSLEIEANSITLLSNSIISGGTYFQISANKLKIKESSNIRHTTEIHFLITDTLIIDSTSGIHSDDLGENPNGTGNSSGSSTGGGSGGGYGGRGGTGGTWPGATQGIVGSTYGSLTDIMTGSRGGGSNPGLGGGKIVIESSICIIDGTISANGGSGSGVGSSSGVAGGGGSGGGIKIMSDNFELSGAIEVEGGNGGSGSYYEHMQAGGGGGGGRIYIVIDSPHNFWNNLSILGGSCSSRGAGAHNGFPGTYYVLDTQGNMFDDNLNLNNQTLYLSGSYDFENLNLINSTIYVLDSLNLDIASYLTIDELSAIYADGVGDNPLGTGYSVGSNAGGGGGAGHGSAGASGCGSSGGNAYGSVNDILDGAKGGNFGGGFGGGQIVIQAPYATIDGTISANGEVGGGHYSSAGGAGGGGSGGGIKIISYYLELSDTIKVIGGNGGVSSYTNNTQCGGGGSGGHIYVETGSNQSIWNYLDVSGGGDNNDGAFAVETDIPQPPLADFTATPLSGEVPLEVNFTDQSIPIDTAITNWTWNFGDGTTSTQQNPTHIYDNHGVYTVSLTVIDGNEMLNIETKEDYITANYSGPVWYVSNDGNDSGQGTIDDPFATINTATSQASSGDSILVYEGLYTQIVNSSKHLFISSIHYPNIDSTTIQNTQVANVDFTLIPQILDKMEIHGFFIDGDGLHISSNGITDTVYINNCHMMNNQTGSGATVSANVIAKFQNCIFENNYHGVNNYDSHIYILNSKIRNNDCSENGYAEHLHGSAIYGNYNNQGGVTLIDTEISDNIGQTTIHLIYGNITTFSLIMDNIQIINNEGDGIRLSENGMITLNNLTISNNTGIGIQSLKGSTLTNSTISNNLSGGLHDVFDSSLDNVIIDGNKKTVGSDGYDGAGISVISNSTLSNVIIKNNSTTSGNGGGIHLWVGGGNVFENVTIKNNHALFGGGISLYGNQVDIVFSETEKCNIYENYALIGTDIYLQDDIPINVIVDTFTVATPTDYYAYPISNITLDITNHTVDPIVGDIYVDPTGSNDNSGTSSGSPYKTISYALLSAFANSSNPGTIHLADGTYSPSTNGEYFPLGGKDNVSIVGSSQEGTILNGDSLTSIFYFEDIDDVTISDLTVTNGTSATNQDGGGIICKSSNPTFNNILITNNRANNGGGGICLENSTPTIINSVISYNNANHGSGIKINDSSGPIIDNSIIKGNISESNGGAITALNSQFYLNNTIVDSNVSTSWGGGIYCQNSDFTLRNTIMRRNRADRGGAIYLHFTSNPLIINTLFTENYADDAGGGIYCQGNSNPISLNSIFWNNSPDQIYFRWEEEIIQGSVTIANSNLQGGVNGIITNDHGTVNGTVNWLDGNIDVDPLFIDPDNGNYNLRDYSLLIGAGIDSIEIDDTWYYAPDTDIEGNIRSNPEGSSPDIGAYENQYGEPQHNSLIYVSTDGNDDGSFGFESAPFATIQAAIDYSWDGDTVLVATGTYYVSELKVNDRSLVIIAVGGNQNVIIDGQGQNKILTVENASDKTFVIDGFTIQNGDAQTQDGYVTRAAGGINYFNNLILQDNGQGTGHTLFRGNHPDSTFFDNCIIKDNSAENAAGIGYSTVTNCLIYGNNGSNNSAPLNECIVKNCTIVDNGGGNPGGAVSLCYEIVNSIIRGNGGDLQVYNSQVTYSDVEGSYDGEGNIDADPLFVDESNGDFHLQWGSPCIDAGDPASPLDPDSTVADMGAYFLDQSDSISPNVSITGLSSNNVGTADNLIINWEANDNWVLDSAFVDMLYATQTIRIDTTLAETGQSTIEAPDSTLESFQLIITVWDYLHNEAMDTSETVTVFDNSPPVVDVLSPGEGFNVPEYEELTVTWVATDNIGLDSVQVYYSNDGGLSFTLMASESGDLSAYTFGIPFGISDSAQVKLLAVDLAGNETEGFSAFFSVTDNTPPTVNLTFPAAESVVSIGDSLVITWNDSDNVGIETISLFYNTSGDWATITENAADINEYDWIIPNEPTDNLQIRIVVQDAVGFSDTSEVSAIIIEIVYPEIEIMFPLNNSVFGTGDLMTIIWNDSSEIAADLVSLYYNTGSDWSIIIEQIENLSEYDWIVVNEPTEILQIRVIGQNVYGYSDTSEVDNIKVQIAYPTIVSASPVSGLIDWGVREFEFTLSQPLDGSTVTTDNIQITSSYSSSLTPTIAYVDASSTIEVVYETSLAAWDTITITLSDQITNIYGYALDGDNDGTGGDSYTVQYDIPMLGDYNNDFQINVDDLAQFMIGLGNNDTNYELGPFSGEIPHVFVSLDQKFDVEDVMAFVMMWNWYFANNTLVFANYEDEGLPITIDAEHDSIYLDIPQDLSAYQVQIQYTPGSFFIGSSDDKDELFLTHEEKELGVYTIMAQPGQDKLAIPIEIRGRDANITISYKGITSQGEVAGKMTTSLTIENIPDEFVLYSNYPNPFNPTTKIDYGLPEASNVQLIIYDILGREVTTLVNGVQDAGYKSITWHGTDAFGRNVGAGVYFYLIQAGEFRQVKKMVLLK
jgi:hypothetical protein